MMSRAMEELADKWAKEKLSARAFRMLKANVSCEQIVEYLGLPIETIIELATLQTA